jgi:hypothetical protein
MLGFLKEIHGSFTQACPSRLSSTCLRSLIGLLNSLELKGLSAMLLLLVEIQKYGMARTLVVGYNNNIGHGVKVYKGIRHLYYDVLHELRFLLF